MDQSFQDYELILVDDGSKDNSVEICEQWVNRYPEKIRLVKKENSGSLFTRRRCLAESKGDYIYIMDSDDYLFRRDALVNIHDKIAETECDLLFFNCTSNEETGHGMFSFPFENGDIFEGDRLPLIYQYYIQASGLNPLWNKVFRRDLVDWEADYSPYAYVTNGTDFFQSTPIISSAKKICYLGEVLYFYRKNDNPSSIVHSFKPTIYQSARANFIRMSEAASSWPMNAEEKNKLLTANCMKMASTSAYKARLIKKDDREYAISYLRQIGEDDIFRKYYDPSCAGTFARRLIVFLLGHRKYRTLAFMISKIRS